MSVTFTLPDKMADQLKQIAQTKQVSVDDVLQEAVAEYVSDQLDEEDVDDDLTEEEVAELKATFESYKEQKAAGTLISQVELNKRIASLVEQIYAQKAAQHGEEIESGS